jgi:DNA-binding beta-propeller fold protein YncE
MLTTLVFANVLASTPIALPPAAPVVMDYLAYDAAQKRLWVPAGNTGNVDVIDASGKVTPVAGFATAPSSRPGRPNMGPSSASVGANEVWVGNRADKAVCAVDRKSLAKGECVTLPSMPDGVIWMAPTHEVWSTTPRDQTLTIVDPKAKSVAATIKLPGDPEGYAVDVTKGIFYTNLEDKDRTLAVDVKTRKVVSDWPAGCGGDGPRGLALDADRHLLVVACSDGASVLDLAHEGKQVGRLKTGGGVDNIDYCAAKKLAYIASGGDAMLHVAKLADNGAITEVATAPTGKGARVVVATPDGTAYVADSMGGKIWMIKAP